MKVEVVCQNTDINQVLNLEPIGYEEALQRTLLKIEGHQIISSWKDSLISGTLEVNLSEFLNVPTFGCFIDKREFDSYEELYEFMTGMTEEDYSIYLENINQFLNGDLIKQFGSKHFSEVLIANCAHKG